MDGRFGLMPLAEYTARANAETFLGIQIETAGALESVAEIAAIPDVDLLFVGPSDLSQILGVTGEFENPKCLKAIESIAQACQRAGKPWGIFSRGPEYAARMRSWAASSLSWAPISTPCTPAFATSRNDTQLSLRRHDGGRASRLPIGSGQFTSRHVCRRMNSLLRFCSIAVRTPVVTRR